MSKLEGLRWDKLEGDPEKEVPKIISQASAVQITDGPPPYPTSKKGKDWSAIEKDMKDQESKEKREGKEAVNQLFQEIYSKGSDEVKKAMNKSYVCYISQYSLLYKLIFTLLRLKAVELF